MCCSSCSFFLLLCTADKCHHIMFVCLHLSHFMSILVSGPDMRLHSPWQTRVRAAQSMEQKGNRDQSNGACPSGEGTMGPRTKPHNHGRRTSSVDAFWLGELPGWQMLMKAASDRVIKMDPFPILLSDLDFGQYSPMNRCFFLFLETVSP